MPRSGICFNSDVETRRLAFVAAVLLAAFAVTGGLVLLRDRDADRAPEVRVADFAPVRPHAGFGVQTQVWSDGSQRAVVSSVEDGGPAAQAGMLDGFDVVRLINGQQVSTASHVYAAIERARPGEQIEVVVERFLPRDDGCTLTEADGVDVALTLGLVEEPAPSAEPSGPYYQQWTMKTNFGWAFSLRRSLSRRPTSLASQTLTGVLVRDLLHFSESHPRR